MKNTILMLLIYCMLWTGIVLAGKYNPERNVGDRFKGFEALPSVDEKAYSLSDFEADVLVIVFTCNSCPYAIDYEDRFQSFQDQYRDNQHVQLIAINCNLVPEDSLENMKLRAKDKAFTFPYLFDESQQTGRDLGALRTPECFVLNQQREIVYMGAFDDNTNPENVRRQYLIEAVEATLNDQSIEVTETPPVGCLIRYKRKR